MKSKDPAKSSQKAKRRCGSDGVIFVGACSKCGNHNGALVRKGAAAVALGRRGGIAKNRKLTKEQRKQIGLALKEARARKRLETAR
jgi:hypothetical protein